MALLILTVKMRYSPFWTSPLNRSAFVLLSATAVTLPATMVSAVSTRWGIDWTGGGTKKPGAGLALAIPTSTTREARAIKFRRMRTVSRTKMGISLFDEVGRVRD